MKSGFGKPFHYFMGSIEILAFIQSISEAHASHSSAHGGEDAILGILYGDAVRRILRKFRGSVKIYGRIWFSNATHIVCAHEPGEVVCNLESIDDDSNPVLRRR
jgi:hypothetical protein